MIGPIVGGQLYDYVDNGFTVVCWYVARRYLLLVLTLQVDVRYHADTNHTHALLHWTSPVDRQSAANSKELELMRHGLSSLNRQCIIHKETS